MPIAHRSRLSRRGRWVRWVINKARASEFGGVAPPGLAFAMDVHTVKAGINYRFGWGSPVVAKY